jgi:CubicO group peptidase (beta-lactamase class C family)
MNTVSSTSSIQRIVQNAVDRNILPGAVIQIIHDGKTVFQEAFGVIDRKTGRPHTKDDLFYLGSTSKPLCVTAVLSLADQGKLSLESPASIWIPELSTPTLKDGTEVRSPTIAEMLSHTSGIYGNATASRFQQRLVWNFTSSLSETAKQIATQPFIYPPGKGFSYGGASMTISGRIAEIITRLDFDDYAAQAVFEKLGMQDTFYRTDRKLKNRLSVLYAISSGRLRKARFQPDARPGSFILPPGGIISTAGDLAKFMHLHLSNKQSKSKKVLSTDLIKAMRSDATLGNKMDFKSSSRRKSAVSFANNKGYGLGWMLDEIDQGHNARIFFHGGAFGTLIWGDAETRLGIVLLTHTQLAQVAVLWDEVISIARNTWT